MHLMELINEMKEGQPFFFVWKKLSWVGRCSYAFYIIRDSKIKIKPTINAILGQYCVISSR